MIRHPLPTLRRNGIARLANQTGALLTLMAALLLPLHAQELSPTTGSPASSQELPAPTLPAPDAPIPSPASIPTAIPTEQAKLIKSIEVRNIGNATIDRNRVLANMSLRVGQYYTQDKSDADVKNLITAGDVANVNILTEPEGDGVKLTVLVEPRTNLGDISFLGNSAITAESLKQDAELKLGTLVDETQLQAASRKIEEVYRKKGFPDVRVTYRQERAADTGFTRVVFTIDEGSRAMLNKVRFEGNTVFTEKELKKLVKVGERDWWKVWNLTKRISNEIVEKDVSAVEERYRNAGHMNAKVIGVDRIPVKDKVDVVFRVNEGPKFEVTGVGIEGMNTYPKTELLPSLAMMANAPYSAEKIKADARMIHDYYGARGYADINVVPRITSTGANRVAVNYAVNEGSKFYLRKVDISGNSKTKDEVIRRELPIVPGDEYSTVKMDAAQRRLENLGYFETPVEFSAVDTGATGQKDVKIEVREKSTGSVNFGAGFSSIDSLVGFVDVTQSNFDLMNWPNFTGAGQKFHLGLKAGSRRKDFTLELTEPWFMEQRLSLGTELYYREYNYFSDVYDQTNIGAAVFLQKPLGEHGRLKGEYRAQQIEIDNIDADASAAIKSEQGSFFQSQLALSFIHDTRDSLFLPRKGHKFEAGLSYSGSFLGGDVDTYGFNLSGTQYFKMPWDTIFSVQGSFETVDNTSGDHVPIFERAFLGGANNLRGYDYRDVGPKDEKGEPLGGNTAAYMTLQYNFPIMEKVRGVVFYDVGVVSNDSYDFGGDVNSDVGFGLHLYILPQGPIRLEFGIPVQSDEFNDSGGKFNFNIGYQF